MWGCKIKAKKNPKIGLGTHEREMGGGQQQVRTVTETLGVSVPEPARTHERGKRKN